MILFHFANALRSFLLVWLGSELLILWFVYNFGYRQYKKSPIIDSLQSTIFCFALLQTASAALPIVLSLNLDFYPIVGNLTIPIVAICIYNVRRFRRLSLWEDKLNLPDQKSIKSMLMKGGEHDDKGCKNK